MLMVMVKTYKTAGSQIIRLICSLDCRVIPWNVCAMTLKWAWLAYLNCSRLSNCPLEECRQVRSDGLHEGRRHTTLEILLKSWNGSIRKLCLHARQNSHVPRYPCGTPQFLKLGHRQPFLALSSSLLLLSTLPRCL